MTVPQYANTGPVKIPETLGGISNLVGASVLVTGGAGGLGQAYAEAFVAAGAFVTVVDINQTQGDAFVARLKGNAQFVKADVSQWDEQVAAFEAAVTNSPHKSIDVVIANAGIIGNDDMFNLQDPTGPPVKPSLKTMDINLTGVLYTTKLAFHYFRRQPLDNLRDRCLILKSSLAGYVDLPGSVQYTSAKFGVRGLMRSLRRTAWEHNIRVNLTAPWYVRTPIFPPAIQDYLDNEGVGFATTEDAAKAMLLIASDKTINGRGIGVVARAHDPSGLLDLGLDDFPSGSLFEEWQRIVLETARILA